MIRPLHLLLLVPFVLVACGDDSPDGGDTGGTGGVASGGTGGMSSGSGGSGGTASGAGRASASEVVGRWDVDRGGRADCSAEPTEWDSTLPGGPGFEFRLSDGQLTAGQCLGGATCSTGDYLDYDFSVDELGFVEPRTRRSSIELEGVCYASRFTAVLQLLEGGQRLRYVETLERAPSVSLGDGDCSEEPTGDYTCLDVEIREMIPHEG